MPIEDRISDPIGTERHERDVARRRFRPYWPVVGLFSALIRRRRLRAIAELAEVESARNP